MKIFGIKTDAEKRSDLSEIWSNVLSFGQAYTNSPSMCLSAVYRATELISDNVAILPIKVKINNQTHKEDLEQHPLNLVFSKGLGHLSAYQFTKLLIQSVIIKGNGYAYIERAEDGTVTGLRYLENADVTIDYNKARNTVTYKCAFVKPNIIQPQDIIHLRKNSWDGINGISVLSYARRTIDISNNTENSAKSFFSNGCNLGGILTVQGNLTEKQKQDIRTNWAQMYNGTDSNGCLLGVLQGNMQYQPIQLNSVDSQMLESRQYNVADIARFFGISPVLIGDLSHTSYNTIEAAQQEFLLHTLQPYIKMVEEEFTNKLLPNDENLEINLDERVLLRTDKQAQANYYKMMLECGILCVNEVRKELGYSEIEGGDKHTIAYTDISQNQINNDNKDNSE